MKAKADTRAGKSRIINYNNEQARSTTCEAVASQTIKLPMCAVTNGTRLTGGHAQQQLITINIRNDYHLPLLLSGDSDLTNDVFQKY